MPVGCRSGRGRTNQWKVVWVGASAVHQPQQAPVPGEVVGPVQSRSRERGLQTRSWRPEADRRRPPCPRWTAYSNPRDRGCRRQDLRRLREIRCRRRDRSPDQPVVVAVVTPVTPRIHGPSPTIRVGSVEVTESTAPAAALHRPGSSIRFPGVEAPDRSPNRYRGWRIRVPMAAARPPVGSNQAQPLDKLFDGDHRVPPVDLEPGRLGTVGPIAHPQLRPHSDVSKRGRGEIRSGSRDSRWC